ncbi:hypothetical protein ES703_14544 [subsurface metagenome]
MNPVLVSILIWLAGSWPLFVLLPTAIGSYGFYKHAVKHTDGTDDIQTADTEQKGLMSSAHATKLASVADGAIANIIEDTTPQLGGELNCQAHSVGFIQQITTGDETTTIDWKLGNKFYFTFGAQNETFTFTPPSNPCNLVLVLKQDAAGSRTATWPASVKWPGGAAPTLSTGANAIDIVCFYWDGSNYFGISSLDFSVPV